MKKSFYLALALTAGLFASCSSDEIAQAPAGLDVNDNEAAAIQIGVAQPGMTRGTGTVGTTEAATNEWAGQTFNLFMFEKGTFTPAQKAVDDGHGGTVNEDIYNNAEMVTPTGGATAASYVIGGEEQFNYYPTTGAYSFWAYRIDDAGTGTAGIGVPVGVGDATATEVKVPFIIDGSQDIMTAIPDEAGDLTKLQAVSGASSATADKIYTAYSARRGITPTLAFKHQLTRLTFEVKAATIEVSDAAPSVGAGATYNGFKVTGITVKSKSTGNIIAAWKDGSTYTAQGVEFNAAGEDWADPTTLVAMPLKSRGKTVLTKQVGDWSDAITVNISDAGIATYGQAYSLGTDGFYAAATTVAYPANTENSYTGVPNTAETTLGDMVAAYVAANPGVAGSITGYAYRATTPLALDVTTNAAANLVDLEEVIPEWTVTTPATHAETTLYTITGTETVVADAAALTAAAEELTTLGDNVFYVTADTKYVNVNVTAACTTPGAADAVYTTTDLYDVTGTEVAAANDAAVTAAQDAAAATGTTVYIVDGTKYVSSEVTVAAVAEGTKTPVGEALLVAPGAPSYEMTLTYKRWKKTSTTQYSEIEGTTTKTIARSGNAAFKAGDSYNIVVTLYKDGDASTDTKLNPWNPSTDGDIEIEGED